MRKQKAKQPPPTRSSSELHTAILDAKSRGQVSRRSDPKIENPVAIQRSNDFLEGLQVAEAYLKGQLDASDLTTRYLEKMGYTTSWEGLELMGVSIDKEKFEAWAKTSEQGPGVPVLMNKTITIGEK